MRGRHEQRQPRPHDCPLTALHNATVPLPHHAGQRRDLRWPAPLICMTELIYPEMPEHSMVVLIGPVGAGTSTIACIWPGSQVLSMDALRETVSDSFSVKFSLLSGETQGHRTGWAALMTLGRWSCVSRAGPRRLRAGRR